MSVTIASIIEKYVEKEREKANIAGLREYLKENHPSLKFNPGTISGTLSAKKRKFLSEGEKEVDFIDEKKYNEKNEGNFILKDVLLDLKSLIEDGNGNEGVYDLKNLIVKIRDLSEKTGGIDNLLNYVDLIDEMQI